MKQPEHKSIDIADLPKNTWIQIYNERDVLKWREPEHESIEERSQMKNKDHKNLMKTNEYFRVHGWLVYKYGNADRCENPLCSGKSKTFEWALKTGCEYEKKRENFVKLCRSCHRRYDWDEEKSEYMRKINLGIQRKYRWTPVNQYLKDGTFVRKFDYVMLAAKTLGINNKLISTCLSGKAKSAGGFRWKYADK